MGFYTKFKFRATLKGIDEIAVNDIKTIMDGAFVDNGERTILCDDGDIHKPKTDNDFFKSVRCDCLLQGSITKQNNLYIIDIKTEFKNYDDEIDKFLEFIEPYIIQRNKTKYLGYSLNEDRFGSRYYISNGVIIEKDIN